MWEVEGARAGFALTEDVEEKGVALSVALGVEADARVISSRIPANSLEDQTLIADNYTGRRVVI